MRGQGVRAAGDRRQRGVGAGGTAVVVVDLGDQRVALGGQPVDRLLRLADQVDQPGGVAAPDLVAAGDTVGGGQQQAGEQTHTTGTPKRHSGRGRPAVSSGFPVPSGAALGSSRA